MRKGVQDPNQSFISCVIPILGINSVDAFISRIVQCVKREVEYFVTMENGKLMKYFIDESLDINTPSIFYDFKEWFKIQETYTARFSLQLVASALAKMVNYKHDTTYSREILREFFIWGSLLNYIKYLRNKDMVKDHRVLMDLINANIGDINKSMYNFVIINRRGDAKFAIECPFNRDSKSGVNLDTPFIFIVKQRDKFYEALYHVKKSNLNQGGNCKFSYHNDQNIKQIIDFYRTNCATGDVSIEQQVVTFLEANGHKIRSYVMDYNFKVTGVVLDANGLFIPFIKQVDFLDIKGTGTIIYKNELASMFAVMDNISTTKEIFKLLSNKFGDFYDIKEIIKGVGVILKQDVYIPMFKSRKSFGYDLDIFLGTEIEDLRITSMKQIETRKREFITFYNAMFESLKADQSAKLEVDFLIDLRNPFPIDYKREKMLKIITALNSLPVYRQYCPRLCEMLLSRRTPDFYILQKSLKVRKMEIILDHADLVSGKLVELINFMKNPYQVIKERLDRDLSAYTFSQSDVKSHVELFKEILDPQFGSFTTVNTKWKGFFDNFESFGIWDAKPYNNMFLYKFFALVKTALQPQTNVTANEMKQTVRTYLEADFKHNGIALLDYNPSYKSLKKKLYLSKQSLDLKEVKSIFDADEYFPSMYEIEAMSKIIGISIFVSGRAFIADKTSDNDLEIHGLRYIPVQGSGWSIMLEESFERILCRDVFQIYVKNEKDVLFTNTDFTDDFHKLLPKGAKTGKSKTGIELIKMRAKICEKK